MNSINSFAYLGLGTPEVVMIVVILGLFIIPIEVVRRWLWSRLFKRLGEKSWKAWVPVVDLWVVFKLGRFPGWFSIITVILLIATIILSLMYPDNPPPEALIVVLAVLVFAIVSFVAIFRITKSLHIHGALLLVYLFAGEMIWLIIANVHKPTAVSPAQVHN